MPWSTPFVRQPAGNARACAAQAAPPPAAPSTVEVQGVSFVWVTPTPSRTPSLTSSDTFDSASASSSFTSGSSPSAPSSRGTSVASVGARGILEASPRRTSLSSEPSEAKAAPWPQRSASTPRMVAEPEDGCASGSYAQLQTSGSHAQACRVGRRRTESPPATLRTAPLGQRNLPARPSRLREVILARPYVPVHLEPPSPQPLSPWASELPYLLPRFVDVSAASGAALDLTDAPATQVSARRAFYREAGRTSASLAQLHVGCPRELQGCWPAVAADFVALGALFVAAWPVWPAAGATVAWELADQDAQHLVELLVQLTDALLEAPELSQRTARGALELLRTEPTQQLRAGAWKLPALKLALRALDERRGQLALRVV